MCDTHATAMYGCLLPLLPSCTCVIIGLPCRAIYSTYLCIVNITIGSVLLYFVRLLFTLFASLKDDMQQNLGVNTTSYCKTIRVVFPNIVSQSIVHCNVQWRPVTLMMMTTVNERLYRLPWEDDL